MFRLLAVFAAGYYFGRNPSAGRQVVSAGQQLLDTYTGQPGTTSVLPNTRIVAPPRISAQGGKCPDGFLLLGDSCLTAQEWSDSLKSN